MSFARSATRAVTNVVRPQARTFASGCELKEILAAQIPGKQAELKELKTKYGGVSLGEVTVDQCIGGGRGVKMMLWETSLLDAEEGIRFRGHSIPELQETLPAAIEGGEPQPEGLLWLLLTGDVPTKSQVDSLTAELHSRAKLPAHVEPMIRNFPKGMHPMTQLSMAILALQTESKFQAAYSAGINKKEYWDPTYEDMLDLIARLPEVCALIYRCSYKDGKVADYDSSIDYSANFSNMLGYTDPAFHELMRLYITIHSDHEGGNASAHTGHLVGSTLADPYLATSGAMCSLAGPLHGLANQEVLGWIQALSEKFEAEGKEVNADTITEFAWDTLNSGQVIPGYGHAVLRKTDPRYSCQREFALKHLPDDPLFKIVSTIFDVMPGVLTEHGKTKNPYPNVDSHSGVLLYHYDFVEKDYYTVLFGLSRAYGVLGQLFWDRALGLPLERPKSVTSEWLNNYCKDKV